MNTWKTKDGKEILISEMTRDHLEAAFKMVVKDREEVIDKYNALVKEYNKLVKKSKDVDHTPAGLGW